MYRVTAVGPGVTPDVMWQGQALHSYDGYNQNDVTLEQQMNVKLDQIRAGWHKCAAPLARGLAPSYDRAVVDGEELRAVMAGFRSGVVVVTVDLDGQRVGLTVASLVSLSLEPPLVGVAVRRTPR